MTLRLVTAFIKPYKLDAVKEALEALGVGGLTVSEVRGFGRQGGHTEVFRGVEYAVEFVPKAKVEVVCDAADVDEVAAAITDAARTGKIGDGKLWTTELGSVLRIRTGERGGEAL